MKIHFPDIYSAKESIRFQFRANHIYILLSGLINLVAGLHLRPAYTGWRVILFWASTTSLLIAPLLLITAFFVEPAHGIASRPLTFYGVLLLLVSAVLAHLPNIWLKQTPGTRRHVS